MPEAFSPSTRRLATLEQAAEFLNCDPRTVRRMIARGEITGYRVAARLLRVDLNEIEARALRVIPATGSGR